MTGPWVVLEAFHTVRAFHGRPYDHHYAMDDESIYCSELIWKAYRHVTGEALGETQTLGELDWQPSEAALRQMENGELPLQREMITPRALAEAEQLERVFRYGW